MQRYPTAESGLAIPIQELGYEVMPLEVKRTQGHHLYFEREWYATPRYRQVFRNLVGHVVRMKPAEHQELTEMIPELKRRACTPRVMAQADVLLDQLIEIQQVEDFIYSEQFLELTNGGI